LAIAAFCREREQGRFRGSTEGAGESIEGARGSTVGQCRAAVGGSLKWVPRLSA